MGRYDLKASAHDTGAVKEKVPTGFYTFQISNYKEKDKEGNWLETAKGDPKIYVICEVVGSANDDGKEMLNTVIFYRPDSPSIKGIGMTRHFLKCIGEPYEGDLEPEPSRWIGRRFSAEVVKNGEYLNLVDLIPADDDPAVAAKSPEEIIWDQ